ncbi:MAG: hypothetical protein ACP5T5_04220 [Thermoprotei archaeon]|nr:hypothetical protein [TACK group archaeon]
MACPYYKNGMCTAVKSASMAKAVVMPYRCKGDYEKCEIYRKAESRRRLSRKAGDEGKVKGLMAYLEMGVSDDPPSRCQYYDAGFCRLYNKFIPDAKRQFCTGPESCPLKEKGEPS